jgi:hypothetical protein
MPSTYTTNTGIEKIGDGEQSGLWGQTTNLNFDIVDRALNGVGTITLSGTTHTLSTTAGVLSDGQFSVLVFAGTPSGPNTVTIAPDTAQKRYWVRNTTAENVILAQGSGATVTVPPGTSKAVYTNGAGATAAVFDLTNTLAGNLTGNVTGDLTGNAGTATALQTARTIGGVSFDGTANINLPGVNQTGNQNTTGSAATLTTARTLTIGSTGKTFNGSADVAWNLSEIGAQASSAQLTSLAALATNGIIARTATNTVTARTITGTADQITVTDGDGVSGNPTIAAVVASKAEAEAGTDNTKLMTALRTKEAIAPVVQGDDPAPRILGAAAGRDSATLARRLPVATVSAGDVVSDQGQGAVLGTLQTASTSNVVAATYTIRSYSGTLRFRASHVGSTTRTSTLELYKNNSLVQAYTATVSVAARTNDVSVAVGDVIEWRHRISNSDTQSIVSALSVSADDPYVAQPLYRLNSNA